MSESNSVCIFWLCITLAYFLLDVSYNFFEYLRDDSECFTFIDIPPICSLKIPMGP